MLVRPRGGRARRAPSFESYGPRGGGFASFSSGPRFPPRGDRFPPMGASYAFPANMYPGQMSQHWYPAFTNPSVVPFAHPASFY